MAERASSTPSATAVEADVLGACLSSGFSGNSGSSWWEMVIRLSGVDTASLFYDSKLILVAHAIDAAFRNAEILNVSTVEDNLALRGGDSLPSSPRDYLLSLVARSNITTVQQLRDAVAVLVDKRALRRLQTDAQRVIQEDILSGESSSSEVAGKFRTLASEHVIHDRDVPTMGEIIERMDSRPRVMWRVPTGLGELDDLFNGGYEPGRFYAFAAGAKVGKTTVMLNSTVEAVIANDIPTLFISLEMHDFEVRGKMMAIITGIEHGVVNDILEKKTKLSELHPDDQREFRNADRQLREARLHTAFVADYGSITLDTISAMVMSVRSKYGDDSPMLVVVDYVQLLLSSLENRTSQQSQVTRTLKLLAMELNVPIVTASQINRKGSESEGMPQPYHLRDGGSIEQDADAIIMLHRQINDSGGDAGEVLASHLIDIWVARNRTGPAGRFTASWDGPTATVMDIDRDKVVPTRQPRSPASADEPAPSRSPRTQRYDDGADDGYAD